MTERLRWGILGTGNIARQFSAGVNASKRGRLVAVNRRSGAPVVGRVRWADQNGAVLAGPDLPGGELILGYGEVTRAVVQVEFNGPPADGGCCWA